jgi:hypothetical protein
VWHHRLLAAGQAVDEQQAEVAVGIELVAIDRQNSSSNQKK